MSIPNPIPSLAQPHLSPASHFNVNWTNGMPETNVAAWGSSMLASLRSPNVPIDPVQLQFWEQSRDILSRNVKMEAQNIQFVYTFI
jgi:hypothetical protein